MKNLKMGLRRTHVLYQQERITVSLKVRAPKRKTTGQDRFWVEIKQAKKDKNGRTLKKREMWRQHSTLLTPNQAMVSFARRRS